MERPSVYQQVDEVKKALQLNQSQFDKVYNAYEKYNKAVFGEEKHNGQFQGPPQGVRGPGGRPQGRGGFGGPGGPGGGMGDSGGLPPGGMKGNPPQFGGNPPSGPDNKKAGKPLSHKEIEKIKKELRGNVLNFRQQLNVFFKTSHSP